MQAAIAQVVGDYDFILLDCPPSLSLLTLNGLCAADCVLIPMQCEYYALEGLTSLLATIRKVKTALKPSLEIEGLVLTMFDSRNRLSHEIASEVRRHFPDKVFASVIPRSVRLSESPSHGLSVLEYETKSVGAERYRSLAIEIMERDGTTAAPA
jgi:chromosome partitioning protein